MELFFTLALPVIVIVGVLRLFRVKWPAGLLIIFGLTAVSTFMVNFTYCEILETKCELDALNAVGYFFHWLIVSASASVVDILIYKFFIKEVPTGAS